VGVGRKEGKKERRTEGGGGSTFVAGAFKDTHTGFLELDLAVATVVAAAVVAAVGLVGGAHRTLYH
jgi:hypothetical protein